MRLSEKTIEMLLCSQLSRLFDRDLFWFGLTQKQEARAGFDIGMESDGRLVLFQVKASAEDRNGARRFHLQHHQLTALVNRANHHSRYIYYVFPLVGTTQELIANGGNILGSTWLLDVDTLSGASIQAPRTDRGTERKSRIHYADVLPGSVRIHSKEYKRDLESAKLFRQNIDLSVSKSRFPIDEDFNLFWKTCSLFNRNAFGVVI